MAIRFAHDRDNVYRVEITGLLGEQDFGALQQSAAAGIDGVTWRDYEEGLVERRPHPTDRRVRTLNKRDRKQDKPTNVLSYPSGEKLFLGDVVLARQTIWREARAQGKDSADHVAHLVVHGTLHLLGHDHETSEADAERMEALERRILAKLGIADPYAPR